MFKAESSLLERMNRKLRPEAEKRGSWVMEITDDGWRNYYQEDGIKCGLYQEISKRNQVATWGEVGGKMWRAEGKTLMVGNVDSDGRWDGDGVIYLYPGLTLSLIGQYEKGKLVVGREGRLVGLDVDRSGLPLPRIQMLTRRMVEYESPGAHHMANNLHARELIESISVYVDISRITNAGEGLFAKTEIMEGSLVSIFNGVRERTHIRTLKATEKWSDYRVYLDNNINIDIPDYYIPCTRYSSTLGHKACHSFSPNSRFSQVFHPRWGKVVCLVAYRDIARHEEITVCYGYKMEIAPRRYSDLWMKHLRRTYGWSKEDVAKYGMSVANCQVAFETRNTAIQARNKEENSDPPTLY